MFPLYIMIVLFLALVMAACLGVYFRVYQRHIDRVMAGEIDDCRRMPAPFHVAIAAVIAFLLVLSVISFAVGFGMGYRGLDDDSTEQMDINTVFAQVKEVEEHVTPVESWLTVETIERNYEPYQEEETFRVYDGLMIEHNDVPASLSDLQEGDVVVITLLTDLGGVEDIIKIEVLDRVA